MATRRESLGWFAAVLEKRIIDRMNRLSPKGTAAVMIRIGAMIERQAKMNIRRQHIIDTGTLLNSVRYKLFQSGPVSGVTVGSYGVPYAAAHEFGFNEQVTVKTHTRTKAFGRATKPYTVPQYTRFQRIEKRPYLSPAGRDSKSKIIELIRSLIVSDRLK